MPNKFPGINGMQSIDAKQVIAILLLWQPRLSRIEISIFLIRIFLITPDCLFINLILESIFVKKNLLNNTRFSIESSLLFGSLRVYNQL